MRVTKSKAAWPLLGAPEGTRPLPPLQTARLQENTKFVFPKSVQDHVQAAVEAAVAYPVYFLGISLVTG